MDLSNKDIAGIKDEVENLVRALHAAHLSRGEGSLETFLEFFDDDIIGIGTGNDEVVFNKKDLTTLLEREWREVSKSLRYNLHSIEVRVLSVESASTQSFIDIYLDESGDDSFFVRLSTVFRKVGGKWRGVHWHASSPWEIQPDGVSWPTDQLEAKARKLQQEVAARTEELSRANRELAFDASIERIRRVTLEMEQPSDLTEVVKQMRREMDVLFPDQVLEVDLMTIADETHYRFWAITDVAEVPDNMEQFGKLYPRYGDPVHPVLDRLWAFDGEYTKYAADAEEMWQVHASLAANIPAEADLLKAVLESGTFERMWFSASSVVGRRLFLAWAVEPPREVASLQPRMAVVLGEAFKRVEELREANRLTREAQIEAALERVRAQATGMRNSDELLAVVATIHQQFSGLGLECGVFWHAHYYPDRYEKALTSVDGSKVSTLMILPRDFSAVPELAVWERGTEPFGIFKFNADKGARYMEHMITKGHFLEVDPHAVGPDDVRANGGLTFVQARTSSGEIGYSLWGEADPEPEAKEVLLRFARVFDLAYRRFEDLREAEQAAREARIEAALERVRARTMAMHSPEDLKEVVLSYGDQLEELGMDIHGAMYLLQDPATKSWTLWTAYANKYPIERLRGATLEFPFDEVEADPSIAAWRRGDSFSESFVPPDNLRKWTEDFEIVLNASGQSAEEWISLNPEGYHRVDAYMKYGVVAAGGARSFTPEEIQIQIRFAKEFERTYQRFLGLKQAQAQARESQIEASLERVRAQAMAMQKPEDIGVTCYAMFEEIQGLCSGVIRLGIGVAIDDESWQPWLVGKNEDGNPGIFKSRIVPQGEREEIDQVFEAWREGRSHWFLESQEFHDWARTTYPDAATRQGLIPLEIERNLYFSAFTHLSGFLYVISHDPIEMEQEEGRIISRFGGVFDLAYKRYNDLQQAEVDYAALLAEKARTEQALTTLQATQKQLVEQEKLASLGSLTAGIAHEIKNPLNFVNNFAEVSVEMAEELRDAVKAGRLEEAVELIAELMNNSAQIAKHGKRADSIVKSMMQHARGGSSDRETIQVNQFLEEYSNLAWHGMRARDHGFSAELLRDFDTEAGSITVMPQELGRVVLNLLNNAFDAVKTMKNAVVTVGSRRSEEGITITVSDNGPGIPDAIRDKIFEPFFTTKATGEGTGLGLSLSYDIVTKGHGGKMIVKTSPNGGATFIITLPS